MSKPKKVEKVKLIWGSPEWTTRLRRSLAQRKRYGANIKDVIGLCNWIEEKGPSKNGSNKTS